MTSLFMGQLFSGGVPASEEAVRATTIPVNNEKPPAEQQAAPEQGELKTDSDPDLGMHLRNLASDWHEGQPVNTSMRLDNVAQMTASTAMVNGQVSTSGFSAGREAAGQAHRSLSYAVGIEPVQDLRSNGAFGNTYFKRNDRPIQDTMTAQMTVPPGYDIAESSQAATLSRARERSTSAVAGDSLYDKFWNGGN